MSLSNHVKLSMLLVFMAVPATRLQAQEVSEAWKQEIERKIDILTKELETSKMGEAAAEPVYKSESGFAPAAAKVYHIKRGVSIGGYGEMVLREFDNERDNGTASGSRRELDFLRAILYTGYKFSDKILFNSEIEFEHGSTSNGSTAQTPRGEVSVEFAYLDFQVSQPLGIRAGMMLVPMGFV